MATTTTTATCPVLVTVAFHSLLFKSYGNSQYQTNNLTTTERDYYSTVARISSHAVPKMVHLAAHFSSLQNWISIHLRTIS